MDQVQKLIIWATSQDHLKILYGVSYIDSSYMTLLLLLSNVLDFKYYNNTLCSTSTLILHVHVTNKSREIIETKDIVHDLY